MSDDAEKPSIGDKLPIEYYLEMMPDPEGNFNFGDGERRYSLQGTNVPINRAYLSGALKDLIMRRSRNDEFADRPHTGYRVVIRLEEIKPDGSA
jgi:hypothetical protein